MTALTLLDNPDDDRAKPTLSFVRVTPDMAARWLNQNVKNRSIRPQTVARYARDMAAGQWHIDGSPIRFAPDGTLLDGQHRLAAIIKSGSPVLTAVARGINPAAQSAMDTGRARTAADALTISGQEHTSTLAAAARLGLQVERDNWDTGFEVSHAEVIDYVDRNPDLRAGVLVARRNARKADCPPAVVAYSFMVLARIDADAALDFWTAAAEKVGLEVGDPVIALTNRFAEARRNREHMNRHGYLSAIYRAWNYRRAGKQLRLVKIASPSGGFVPIPEPK